jgi:hypothetical protein
MWYASDAPKHDRVMSALTFRKRKALAALKIASLL